MKRTLPKSPEFSEFTPDPSEPSPERHMDRTTLAGLSPEATAKRIADFCAAKRIVREITRDQQETGLRIVFRYLAQKQKDAASIDPETMSTLREYFRILVKEGQYSEAGAGHLVKVWNTSMRLAFGEEGEPGEGLLMKRFPTRARKVDRYDETELAALVSAASRMKYRSKVDKDAFETYLEIACCAGNRIGSLVYVVKGRIVEEATFRDIDWEKGTLRFRHMKNRPEHKAVLTDAALARLRKREMNLRAWGLWRGDDILLGKSGSSLHPYSVNKMLKRAAKTAGIKKPLSTHVIRKSVGTHIGRYNPRYAAEQLGISMRVFETHYNQPTIEDRLARRDTSPEAPGSRRPRRKWWAAHGSYEAAGPSQRPLSRPSSSARSSSSRSPRGAMLPRHHLMSKRKGTHDWNPVS